MATIDELARLDREVREAEQRALLNLADHLRGALLELPSTSKLARSFVKYAARFEQWAGAGNRGHEAQMGDISMAGLERDVQENALEGLAEILREYADRLPVDDALRPALCRVADAVA